MSMLPQSPQELLEIIKTPLGLLERAGIHIDVQNAVTSVANQLPTDTSGVFPWLQELWTRASQIMSGGDVLGGIWDLVKMILTVVVGLLGALVDLLRSFVSG